MSTKATHPDIVAMAGPDTERVTTLAKRTDDPAFASWLVGLAASARASSGLEEDAPHALAHPAWRQARLLAGVAARPIVDVLREWYVFDAASGTLVHRHLLPAFRRDVAEHFCGSCGKVLFDALRGGIWSDPADLAHENPRCASCWFGLADSERYFEMVTSLWRPLLRQTKAVAPHVFVHDGVLLHLHTDADMWGVEMASVLLWPRGGESPRDWAAARGVEVVEDADVADIFGGLAPDTDTLRDTYAEIDATASEIAALEADPGADPMATINAARRLAGALQRAGRHPESIDAQRENLARLAGALGETHCESLYSHAMLARSLQAAADSGAAMTVARQVARLVRQVEEQPDADRPWPLRALRHVHRRLAECFGHEAMHAEESDHWARCWRHTLAPEPPGPRPAGAPPPTTYGDALEVLDMLVHSQLASADVEGAVATLEEARAQCSERFPRDHRDEEIDERLDAVRGDPARN